MGQQNHKKEDQREFWGGVGREARQDHAAEYYESPERPRGKLVAIQIKDLERLGSVLRDFFQRRGTIPLRLKRVLQDVRFSTATREPDVLNLPKLMMLSRRERTLRRGNFLSCSSGTSAEEIMLQPVDVSVLEKMEAIIL